MSKGLPPFKRLPKKLLSFINTIGGEDAQVAVGFSLLLFLFLFKFVQLGLGGLPGAFVGLFGWREGGREGGRKERRVNKSTRGAGKD
jgi:hypothetical protein